MLVLIVGSHTMSVSVSLSPLTESSLGSAGGVPSAGVPSSAGGVPPSAGSPPVFVVLSVVVPVFSLSLGSPAPESPAPESPAPASAPPSSPLSPSSPPSLLPPASDALSSDVSTGVSSSIGSSKTGLSTGPVYIGSTSIDS